MAEFVFSGAFPHDLLDLHDWRWQGPVQVGGDLGREGDGKAISVPADESDTTEIATFRDDPWFVLVDEDPTVYVRLRAPAKGSTTGTASASTTRSELREMHFPERGRKASWDATGDEVHNLKVRLAVRSVMERDGRRSRVGVAQVHKTSEDGIIVYLDGASGKLRWKQDSVVQPGSLGDYTLGSYVNIGLSVHGGLCTIYVDDVPKAEGKLTGSAAKTCYFKTGCYNQDNSSDDGYPDDAVNEVRIAAVRAAHETPWTPGGYTPVGPGVGAIGHGQWPRDLIEFAGPHQAWKLTLDVDADERHGGDAAEKTAAELAAGFLLAGHFEVVEDGTAVRFRSHLGGARTGHTTYPRTELREMRPDAPGKQAGWRIAKDEHATHRLTAQVKPTHAPATPQHNGVVIGQIHTATDDLLEIMFDGKRKAVGYRWNGTWQDDVLIADYTPDQGYFTYRVEVAAGTVRIAVDTGDGFQDKVTKTNVSASKCYFKAGAYTQSNADQDGAHTDDYGEALFRSITVDTET